MGTPILQNRYEKVALHLFDLTSIGFSIDVPIVPVKIGIGCSNSENGKLRKFHENEMCRTSLKIWAQTCKNSLYCTELPIADG